MNNFLKIFYVSIFRTINLLSLNQAVNKVNVCTTRNSTKTATSTDTTPPLETNSPPVRNEATECKEFSIVIPEKEKDICRGPPKAHRAKPLTGPNKQLDHKTLAQMKKTPTESLEAERPKNVIEDCEVTVDESTYGDWLIKQGLNMDVDILSDETDETRVNDECKNTSDKPNVKVPSPETKTGKEKMSNRNDNMICKKEDGDTIGMLHAADPGKQMASQAIDEPIHKNFLQMLQIRQRKVQIQKNMLMLVPVLIRLL